MGGDFHGRLSNYIIRLLDNHGMYVDVFFLEGGAELVEVAIYTQILDVTQKANCNVM